MLDDFQEVARYDLSNRLVPSVRTYGCKLALTFFLCLILFPAFPLFPQTIPMVID